MYKARPSQSAYPLFPVHPHRQNRASQGRSVPKWPQEGGGDKPSWNMTADSASQAAEVLTSLYCALLHVWRLGQDRSSRSVRTTSQTPAGWHCLVPIREPPCLHGNVGGSTPRGLLCPPAFSGRRGCLVVPSSPPRGPQIKHLPGLSANEPVKSPSGRVLGNLKPHCGFDGSWPTHECHIFNYTRLEQEVLHFNGNHPPPPPGWAPPKSCDTSPDAVAATSQLPGSSRHSSCGCRRHAPQAPPGEQGWGFSFLGWQLLSDHLGL